MMSILLIVKKMSGEEREGMVNLLNCHQDVFAKRST